jgi:hypothetical protein
MQEKKGEGPSSLQKVKRSAMKFICPQTSTRNAKFYMVIFHRSKEKLLFRPLEKENYR